MTKKVLFLDVETTSFDLLTAEIIEFSFIQSDHNYNIIKSGSVLIKSDVKIPFHIGKKLGINDGFLDDNGSNRDQTYLRMEKIISESDILISHGGLKFDYPLISKKLKNEDLFEGKVLLDTTKHLPSFYYKKCDNKSLRELSIMSGVVIPDFNRSILKSLAMFSFMRNFSLDLIINISQRPITLYQIDCHYEDKNIAQILSSEWNSSTKRWEIELTEDDFISLSKEINEINQTSPHLKYPVKLKKIGL